MKDTITLDTAEVISRSISTYEGTPHIDSVVKYVEQDTVFDRETILTVIQFLQTLNSGDMLTATEFSGDLETALGKKLNISDELHYNYAVAKTLLQRSLEKPDNDDIRKTLREISRFMDAILKMQEKVYNIQQMQLFQEKVLEIVGNVSPEDRETLLLELTESDL